MFVSPLSIMLLLNNHLRILSLFIFFPSGVFSRKGDSSNDDHQMAFMEDIQLLSSHLVLDVERDVLLRHRPSLVQSRRTASTFSLRAFHARLGAVASQRDIVSAQK